MLASLSFCIYSTIYKKTVTQNGGPSSGETLLSLGVKINNLVNIYGSLNADSVNVFFPIPYVRRDPSSSPSDQIGLRVINQNNISYVRLEVGSGNFAFADAFVAVTVFYTK